MSDLSVKQNLCGIASLVGTLMVMGGMCGVFAALAHGPGVLFQPVLYTGLAMTGVGFLPILFSAALLSKDEREGIKEKMKSIIPFENHEKI